MKDKRHNAIRELLVRTAVSSQGAISSQDALRRRLASRGIHVTQATLSRDIRELKLLKGPGGYALPNPDGESAGNDLPELAEILGSFALGAQQAQNQVVIHTVTGGAQPVAASLDFEGWPEVVGTLAGENTVLVVCPDSRTAASLQAKLEAFLA